MKKFLIAIFSLTFLWNFSQEYRPITEKMGLPNCLIYSITDDLNGFIWLATNKGAIRFNGARCETFNVAKGLSSQDVWDLSVDPFNRVWYNVKSKKIGYIQGEQVVNYNIANNASVTPQYEFVNTDVYLVKNPYYKLEYYEFRILYSAEKVEGNTIMEKYPATFFYYYSPLDHHIYIFDKNGVGKYRPDTYTLVKEYSYNAGDEYLIQNPNPKNYLPIKDFFLYNQVRYSFRKAGLFTIDEKNKIFNFYPFEDLGANNVENFYQNNHQYYISDHNRYSILDKNFHLIDSGKIPEYAQASTNCIDSIQNLFVAHSKGVSYLPVTVRNSRYPLKNIKIHKLFPVDNEIALGIHNKGIAIYNPLSDQLNWIPSSFVNRNLTIREFTEIEDTPTFITDNYIIEFKNNQVSQFHELTIPYMSKVIKSFEKINGTPYIGTSSNIYNSIDNDNPNAQIQSSSRENITVLKNFKNNLLVGTTDGLRILDGDTLREIYPKSLPNNITCLRKFNDGVLVGTDGKGMFYFDGKEIRPFGSTEGFYINEIRPENENWIWVATDNGVLRIEYNGEDQNGEIRNRFTLDDGLLSNNANDLMVKGDSLWVASEIGLAVIPWKTNMNINTTKIFVKNAESNELEVSSEERSKFQIELNILDLIRAENLEISYKIPGYSNEWLPISNESQALLLPKLNPHHYELIIRTKNLHHKITQKTLKINVLPYWYEHTLSKILFILLGIILLYFVWKKWEERRISKIQREQHVVETELFALRSQMNPHFIHNSLNSIQYLIQDKMLKSADQYLSNFSQLVRLFFDYSMSKNISIDEEVRLLNLYLDLEKLRFEKRLNFTISVDEKINPYDEIPSMLVQPFVENAVIHGIFHKKDGGNIDISFRKIGDTYTIEIRDSGIGLSYSKIINQKKTFKPRSGSVTKKRIDLINKGGSFWIDLDIQELKENQVVKGTSVKLKIKKL